MTAYKVTVSNSDLPKTDEEWESLSGGDLAAALIVEGMLASRGHYRAVNAYVRSHIAMTRTNLDAERQQSQMRIDVYGPVPVDDDRAEIRSRILGELQRRGLPVGLAGDNGNGNGRPHDSPETA